MKNKKLIIVVLILVFLVAARNIIIRVGLEQGIRMVTGLRTDIGKFNIGVIEPAVTIQDLKLYNPAGYPDPMMADISEIYFRYKLGEILKGKIYLKEFRFSLRELFIIRRSENQLNIDALNSFQSPGNGPQQPFTIDDFTLKINTVVYKDYTHIPTSLTKRYNLNIYDHYSGIRGMDEFERLVMLSVLNKTSIASFIRVDLNKLKDGLSDTLLNSLKTSDNSIKGLLNDF